MKKIISSILGLAVICGLGVTIGTSAVDAAGCSPWVTTSISKPFCKNLPYSGTTKPFTGQNHYKKRTCVDNKGKTTTKTKTDFVVLAAGCK